MRPILLDTNTYSAFKRGNLEIIEVIQHAEVIGISPIVLGELYSGFDHGKQAARNREELQHFLSSSRIRIYSLSEDTSNYYCQIYVRLRKKGQPIPTNDMWIAAQALEHGCMLCTLDKHFDVVTGLLTVRHVSDL